MESVILLVSYTCKPGQAAAFVRALKESGVQEKIRAEDGCLRYDYHLSCETPDAVVLLERWRDAKAQEVHMTQPHMADVRRWKDAYVLDTRVERLK